MYGITVNAIWPGARSRFREAGAEWRGRYVEKIVAWGGFASVQHVSKYIQPGIDLITVGSRGLSGLKGLFLGSVSHKLIEETECPCLVVK